MNTSSPTTVTSMKHIGPEFMDSLIGCLVVYRFDKAGLAEVISNAGSLHLFIGRTELRWIKPGWLARSSKVDVA